MRRLAALVTPIVVVLSLAGAPQASAKGSGSIQAVAGGGGLVEPNLAARHCFQDPEEGTGTLEACGYADLHNTGVEAASKKCSEFTKENLGLVKIEAAKTVVKNKWVKGNYVVEAPEVKFENDCIENGGGSGSSVIELRTGATNTVIKNSTLRGEGPRFAASGETKASTDFAVAYNFSGTSLTLESDSLYYCGECVHGGNGNAATIKKSFIWANGMEEFSEGAEVEHWENIFYAFGGKLTIEESTLFNAHPQTAVVFGEGASACTNDITITMSFLGGGGFIIYPCSHATSVGTSKTNITKNRLPKCTGTIEEKGATSQICTHNPWLEAKGKTPTGIFTEGYYPHYGAHKELGVGNEYFTGAGQVWTENFDDATGAEILENQ